MNEEDSVYQFTHADTVVSQKDSHFQNGILFPDGSFAWGSSARVRGYSLPEDSVPTQQEQGKLQDQHALNLKVLGIEPTSDLRLRFVRRAVVVSYGDAEEVPEWL